MTAKTQADVWLSDAEVLEATKGRWVSGKSSLSGSFRGASADSRTLLEGDLFIALQGDRFDGHTHLEEARMRGAHAALVERCIDDPLPQILVGDTKRAMIALASRIVKKRKSAGGRMVVLTGSAGKTTTRELIRCGLSSLGFPVLASVANENNEIGVPKTLWGWQECEPFSVIEVGVRKQGDIDYFGDLVSSDALVITSIGPSHLETLGTLTGVWSEKSKLLSNLSEGGVFVLPEDVWVRFSTENLLDSLKNRKIHLILTRLKGKVSTPDREPIVSSKGRQAFTLLEASFDRKDQGYVLQGELSGELFSIRMEIPSPDLAMDMLLALAVCQFLGLPVHQTAEAIGTYNGSSGRMQPLRTHQGVLFLLDHYNANPLSMEAAFSLVENMRQLEPGKGRIWGILGEMLELGRDSESWHRFVGAKAARLKWAGIWFKGGCFDAFREGFASAGGNPSLLIPLPLNEGSDRFRYEEIASGDIVLVKASRGTFLESEFPILGLDR